MKFNPKHVRYAETGLKGMNALASGIAAGWLFKKKHPILGTLFLGAALVNALATEVELDPGGRLIQVGETNDPLQDVMDRFCRDPEGTKAQMAGDTSQLAEDFRSIIKNGTYTCG